jgi:hypothetical protein
MSLQLEFAHELFFIILTSKLCRHIHRLSISKSGAPKPTERERQAKVSAKQNLEMVKAQSA